MKTLAFAALALVACGTEYQLPDSGNNQAAIASFQENCATCHGEFGEGSPDGPQIQNPVRDYATYVIRNGRDVQMTDMNYTDEMPAHGTDIVSDTDLTGILDYLSQPAHPTDGHGLYKRFCANCHGQSGYGGRAGESATGESDEAKEKIRDGHGGHKFWEQDEYMPKWGPTELTSTEIALIVQWLDAQPGGGGDGGDECVSPEDDCDGHTDED